MCRNIKTLFNFDPSATGEEIRMAAEQFVRKISGFSNPSEVNEAAFNKAVDEVAHIASHLFGSLTTNAHPHNRKIETQKAHERALKRFGSS